MSKIHIAPSPNLRPLRLLSFLLLPLAASLSLGACANPGEGSAEAVEGAAESLEEAETTVPNERIERRLTHMAERLELTEEQVALVRPILENHRRGPEGREEFHAELEGILTPDQLATMEETRGHGPRGQRGRHHGPRDPAEMLGRMTEHLDLTEAQVAELTPLFEQMGEQREQLRDLPREERRESMMAAREEMKAAIDAVITAEQRVLLEEHRALRREHRGNRPGRGRGFRGHDRGHGGPELLGD